MTDEQLEQIMSTYTQYLVRIGYYYTKDLACSREFVQDVFVQFYYANYEEQGNLKAYLARLMVNRCKDYLRSWSYRKLVLQQTFFSEQMTKVTDSVIEQEEREALDEVILSLKVKLREVIVYYYLEDMTSKEIAELIQTPESTIKTRLQTARKALKEMLHDYQWEVLMHE